MAAIQAPLGPNLFRVGAKLLRGVQHSSPFLLPLLLVLLLSRAPSVCLRALSKELYLSVGYNSPASARREGGRGAAAPSVRVRGGGMSAAIVQMRGRIGTGREKRGKQERAGDSSGKDCIVAALSRPIL